MKKRKQKLRILLNLKKIEIHNKIENRKKGKIERKNYIKIKKDEYPKVNFGGKTVC